MRHRPYDLVAVGVLGEVAAGAGLERREERIVVGVGRQDHDLCARMLGADPARRLHAVAARHAQVHQDHVRGVFGDQPQRLLAVTGRTDHLDARQQPQQHHDALAHHRLVIGHDDPSRRPRRAVLSHAAPCHTRHPGTRSRTTNPSCSGPAGPASRVPPSSSARSRIPRRPYPEPVAASSPAARRPPPSRISSSTSPSR